ncbi:MAG: hypothetical protein KKF33_13800 [Alphaproteobacteria bacterium]|nr:hypothetical protein [Alphaproteobacteria bacterium]
MALRIELTLEDAIASVLSVASVANGTYIVPSRRMFGDDRAILIKAVDAVIASGRAYRVAQGQGPGFILKQI